MDYILNANNVCGDPLNPIIKPSRRVRTSNFIPNFDVDIALDDLLMNPCNMDTIASNVSMTLTSGMATTLDSIKMNLPPGIIYVSGSYMAGQNASSNAPVVIDMPGNQMLIWPIDMLVNAGGQIDFSVELTTRDAAQKCLAYELQVYAYARTNEFCGPTECSISIIAGEGQQTIEIIKPDLDFTLFDGMLTLNPSSGEADLMVSAEVCNSGAFLAAGGEIQIDIYEDNDLSGDRSMGDAFLFSLTETMASDLGPGDCVSFAGMATFNAGDVCTIIGVLNPDSTCVCSELPSGQLRPAIKIDFPQDLEVCSDDPLMIGPDPVSGYQHEWYGINGAPEGALSSTLGTPVTFTAINTTGADIIHQYVLFSSTKNCYALDTITIILHAKPLDEINVQACIGFAYQLPSPPPGSINPMWSMTTGLTFPDPMDMTVATIDPVTVDEIITLTYTDPNGCPGELIVNLSAIDCGTAVAGLGDTVWFDINEDGIQDDNEPPIAGVVVNLYDGNGMWLGSTITDVNGFYSFENLVPGTYRVEVVALPGFISTMQNTGTNDSIDSDINASGFTPNTYVSAGEFNPTLDAGFIPDCTLDVEIQVGDCEAEGDRQISVIYTWSGNTYTYDQFFAADTLDFSILGMDFRRVIDTLEGKDTLTFPVDASTILSVDLTASFVLATGCNAIADLGDFDPCIFDVALKKGLTSMAPYGYGDTACYEIVVFNQEIQPIKNIQVTDYLPSGLTFIPALNSGWGLDGSGNLKANIEGPLLMGESDTLTLKLRINPSLDSAAWTNYAEVSRFEDTTGTDVSTEDQDSEIDDNEDNDGGGAVESPADDYVDGDGTGPIGGGDAATDEDGP